MPEGSTSRTWTTSACCVLRVPSPLSCLLVPWVVPEGLGRCACWQRAPSAHRPWPLAAPSTAHYNLQSQTSNRAGACCYERPGHHSGRRAGGARPSPAIGCIIHPPPLRFAPPSVPPCPAGPAPRTLGILGDRGDGRGASPGQRLRSPGHSERSELRTVKLAQWAVLTLWTALCSNHEQPNPRHAGATLARRWLLLGRSWQAQSPSIARSNSSHPRRPCICYCCCCCCFPFAKRTRRRKKKKKKEATFARRSGRERKTAATLRTQLPVTLPVTPTPCVPSTRDRPISLTSGLQHRAHGTSPTGQ